MRTANWAMLGLVLVAAATCAAQMPDQGISVSKENRTIAITATDSVTAKADVATVHIGCLLYGIDQDTAYAAGSKASNAIVDALKAAGVPADAIESQNQGVEPVQAFQLTNLTDTEKAKRKFVASQTWTVRVNAGDAARTLDIAVKAGANNSGQIDWSLKDENTPQTQAAGKALQRARDVAQAMASGLSVKLGVLIYASNTTEATPVRPLMAMRAAGAPAPPPPQPLAISPQQITKTATVYAVFAIE